MKNVNEKKRMPPENKEKLRKEFQGIKEMAKSTFEDDVPQMKKKKEKKKGPHDRRGNLFRANSSFSTV